MMEDTTSFALMTLVPFICIGIIFIGMGYAVKCFMNRRLHRCNEIVSAKVVDIDWYSVRVNRQLRKKFCRPLLEFTVGKKVIRAVTPDGASKNDYCLGEDVLIHYNPDRPDEIIIRYEYEKGIRKVFMTFIIMGLCIPLLGILLGGLMFMVINYLI